MGTLGEIFRWLGISINERRKRVARLYRRAVARLLRRDELVARSEHKFQALLESAPDAVVIVDVHGHIQLVNTQAERLFGWSRDEIVGQNVGELIPHEARLVHREHLGRYLKDPKPRAMGGNLELFGLRKDGGRFPIEISLGPLETDQGLLVSAAIRDASARKRGENALREAEERFRTAFQEAPVGMAVASLDGHLLEVNRAMCEITGYSQEDLESMTFEGIAHPEEVEEEKSELELLRKGEVTRLRAERRYIHAEGHPVPVDLSVAVVHDGEGAPRHFLVQAHDMTERKRFEGQLQYLVDHDPLTGMFNRRRFEQELTRELARSARYGSTGAVLAIDLDHFKYVNDTLGHSAGDELITRVSAVFQRRLRSTDVIARLGGDEFSVILPGVEREEALGVARNLLSALHEEAGPDIENGGPKRVTASIGVALFGDQPLTGEELLVEADIAMYDAKEAGRDRVEVYDSAQDRQERMQARLTWADRIQDALEQDRFVLHAQPIASLNGDPVPRVELLIRMLGEGDDLIPPGTFLYIAERFDMIQVIDRWVLQQAIAVLAAEKGAGREIHLEVNLSAKSVTDPDLPEFVATELAAAGIDGHGLCVEVTETAAIVNLDRARRCAELLGELGCEFALDDFGAGFASFYYLKHLAFDYVKIDGEFIRNLRSSHVNQLIVKAVVSLANGLGKRTIAEFVGDGETVELLQEYGVDYAQGFHIGKPKPLNGLELAQPPVAPVAPRAPVGGEAGVAPQA